MVLRVFFEKVRKLQIVYFFGEIRFGSFVLRRVFLHPREILLPVNEVPSGLQHEVSRSLLLLCRRILELNVFVLL